MLNPVRFVYETVAARLASAGLIDRGRGERVAGLAWPRFLTMFARDLYRVADIAMVGLAIGPAAIAGLAYASIYWGLANAFSLGLAGGTISQVSQRFGAGTPRELDLAVKQSVWIGLLITVPFVLVYWTFAEPLVGLVGDDPTTVALGAAYLQLLSLALFFNVLNQAASRTLAGADDTWIAMSLRATGALLNIVLNAIFIFGLGMGVQGAALGTVLAEGTITLCLAWGFVGGHLPLVGDFPVTLSIQRPYLDVELSKQLLRISPPLIAEQLARSFARFPLFAILALFGPTIVASFEV
ncbi:MAG: MATE family efflux transporter, partial [Haloferacaceae archaeon]